MKISNIKYFCTTNGDGFRTAVFVSGCNLHCKGCFNSKAWDFDYGMDLDNGVINKIVDSLSEDYIEGLSVLGGEPMDARNQEGVRRIIETVRDKYGDSKDIWMWSGYYFDKMPKTDHTEYILDNIDYLIDGPFEIDKSSLLLKYKGSENQRVLDFKKTRETGKIVLYNG